MKKTLLIMTVGGTDVQLVVGGKRHKLDGNCCGSLHDEIKGRSWSLVDAPNDRPRDFISTLPGGALELCTPKLDAILAHLGDELPTAVLIFETNRKDPREPRLAGEVLQSRLAMRDVMNVTRVAFLTGTEQLEDPKDRLDAIVRRSVVAILSRATAQQLSELQQGDRVFIATTGGLAAVNEVLIELVRLHAVGGPEVTALEVPDGNRGQQDEHAVEETFHPASGYRARWHALSLIQKGNLLGAWGAVSHLKNQPGQEWIQVIEWLSLWASSLPLPSACDIALLKYAGKGRRAVRSALQVELALRAGNIPSAVHGTVAFFESALWDHLLAVLLNPCQTDSQRYSFKSTPSTPVGFPFKKERLEADGTNSYLVDTGKGGCTKLVTTYLNEPALLSLHQAISGTDENSPSPVRSLRNDVAHNVPTEAEMSRARQVMRDAKLWSGSEPPQFLCQDLVRNVLAELGITVAGVTEPAKLCEKLISDVEQRILSPS